MDDARDDELGWDDPRPLPASREPAPTAPLARPVRPAPPTSRRERRRQEAAAVPPGSVLPHRPGLRGRRAARLASWVAVVTSITVLAAASTGWALVSKYDSNIDRIEGALSLPGVQRPPERPTEAQNILVVGSDSRGDLSPGEGPQGRGAEYVTGQRADTVILAHLYGDSDQAELVSLPRDSYVDIPAHTDPVTGTTTAARSGKLNSAFLEGGPGLLVATVEQLTGIRVDHYVQVDFDGFTSIVDHLGGVEVCLTEPAKERFSGVDLPAGRSVVQGDQALAFVRQRMGLARGDIDRIQRQQQFLGAVLRKTLSAGTLLNPLKLDGLLDIVTSSLQVDEGLTVGDLRDLALRMRDVSAGGLTFTTVPLSETSARRGGESVVLLDDAAAQALFSRLRRDLPVEPAEAPAPGALDPFVPPSVVQVQVFNGAGVPGLGGRVADDLAVAGFDVAGPAADRGASARRSTVLHGPDRADAARTLAAALGEADVALDPSLDGTLEVVAGSEYDGMTPVPVPPVAPAPPVPALPAPGVLTAAGEMCGP